MTLDKGADLPPLLINPSAPLAPFQPGMPMCEPLEKPDTPTGGTPLVSSLLMHCCLCSGSEPMMLCTTNTHWPAFAHRKLNSAALDRSVLSVQDDPNQSIACRRGGFTLAQHLSRTFQTSASVWHCSRVPSEALKG